LNFKTLVYAGIVKVCNDVISTVLVTQDTLYEGSISRDVVAHVAVEALKYPEASYKVVEIVSRADVPNKSVKELFASIQ
jgi:hypothetical protein